MEEKFEKLKENLRNVLSKDRLMFDELMSAHTSFKIGGPCDVLALPKEEKEFVEIIKIVKALSFPYYVMGNGSNILVSDKGIRGLVIKTDKMDKCDVLDDSLEAGAGILLSKLSNIALENSLTGLEFASGIPGTLGGAIYMNAGAYDGEISKVLESTIFSTSDGVLKKIDLAQHEFGYRQSVFHKNGGFILKSRLKLKKGNKDEILEKMKDFTSRRTTKQPLEMPSAGSTFKRPEGYFAGKLIMDAGLSGRRVGGAVVSQKHCGFVVNDGGATANDVLQLVEMIKREVKQKFDVELNPEIKFVGEK